MALQAKLQQSLTPPMFAGQGAQRPVAATGTRKLYLGKVKSFNYVGCTGKVYGFIHTEDFRELGEPKKDVLFEDFTYHGEVVHPEGVVEFGFTANAQGPTATHINWNPLPLGDGCAPNVTMSKESLTLLCNIRSKLNSDDAYERIVNALLEAIVAMRKHYQEHPEEEVLDHVGYALDRIPAPSPGRAFPRMDAREMMQIVWGLLEWCPSTVSKQAKQAAVWIQAIANEFQHCDMMSVQPYWPDFQEHIHSTIPMIQDPELAKVVKQCALIFDNQCRRALVPPRDASRDASREA